MNIAKIKIASAKRVTVYGTAVCERVGDGDVLSAIAIGFLGERAVGRRACGLKAIAARFARGVNRVFSRAGRVLADRCHVHVLKTPREVRNAIAYVLLNARRHLAKSGRAMPGIARIDPASSGRWFTGWRANAPVALDLPAVAAPRSWLLSIGWRRPGLIDREEVPGLARARPRTR